MSGISDGSFSGGSLITIAAVRTPAWGLGFRILRLIALRRRTDTGCRRGIESSLCRFWAGSITSIASSRPRERRGQRYLRTTGPCAFNSDKITAREYSQSAHIMLSVIQPKPPADRFGSRAGPEWHTRRRRPTPADR